MSLGAGLANRRARKRVRGARGSPSLIDEFRIPVQFFTVMVSESTDFLPVTPSSESLKKRGVEDFFRYPAPANLSSGDELNGVFGSRFHTWIPASESVSQIAVHHLCADL